MLSIISKTFLKVYHILDILNFLILLTISNIYHKLLDDHINMLFELYLLYISYS